MSAAESKSERGTTAAARSGSTTGPFRLDHGPVRLERPGGRPLGVDRQPGELGEVGHVEHRQPRQFGPATRTTPQDRRQRRTPTPSTSGPPGRPKPLPRFSAGTLAFGAVAIVVVVVLVVVILAVTGGKRNNGGANANNFPPVTTADPAVVQALATVPTSTIDAVGTGGNSVAGEVFTVKKDQPPLKIDGKPGAIFVGGLFCPLCGADRWAMVQAFSRFRDVHGTPADDVLAGGQRSEHGDVRLHPHHVLEPVRRLLAGRALRQRHLLPAGADDQRAAHRPAGPFIRQVRHGRVGPLLQHREQGVRSVGHVRPGLLSGSTWSQVAAALSNPKNPITQAIIGSANYITAGICAVDGQQPANVCSASGVKAAATAMGLG